MSYNFSGNKTPKKKVSPAVLKQREEFAPIYEARKKESAYKNNIFNLNQQQRARQIAQKEQDEKLERQKAAKEKILEAAKIKRAAKKLEKEEAAKLQAEAASAAGQLPGVRPLTWCCFQQKKTLNVNSELTARTVVAQINAGPPLILPILASAGCLK